ncbi:uncharacterized protein LOC118741774 [Rhagoletis pomonella]|uniref:uncharacterized protein LOC118741774 n=1 Tax=Rhagoletis pomonella TaxID=28610 RepID=UPI00178098E9|nr:uncharacterized protein LOC118741774 [Rhagoletis pomonella]
MAVTKSTLLTHSVDMDEADHREIMSVMGGSLSRLPGSLNDDVLSTFLTKYPELKEHIEAKEEKTKRESFEFDVLKTTRWTELHQEFVRESQSLVSIPSICEPDKLWELVRHKQRPNYELVRALAIQKLGNDIKNCLYIRYELTKSSMNDQSIKTTNLEHFHLFSWTEDRFLARRQLKGIAWLDIFEASLSEKYLEAFKLQVDILELARLIKPVLLSFYSENKEYVANAVRMIDDAHKLLDMHNTIQQELKDGVAYLCEIINTITNMSLKRRSQGRDIVKNFLELETMASWVRYPIENRYQLRYSKERVAEWKDLYDSKERQLSLELRKAKRKYSTEMNCFRLMLQSMNITINEYKIRIATMSDEYDRRFNEINDKNIKLKSDIDKMAVQRKFLEAEMEYMKVRVRDILAGVESDKVKKGKRVPRQPSQISLSQKSRSSVLSFRKNIPSPIKKKTGQ